ncbi:MAG: hypothetical protein J3Q66DRAFT_367281 [Benniella sp.]|nr:MAG: hypothetical protein J3Q66DRAFT_367281 [Benniella sp.]
MEAMDNDALAPLLRDGAKITGSSVSASTVQTRIYSYSDLISLLDSPVPMCDTSLQSTATPINAVVPAQAFHGRHTLEPGASVHDGSHFLHAVLPPVDSLQLQLNPRVLTLEPHPCIQQPILQNVCPDGLEQQQIQQLQSQLVLKDQHIQNLQWNLSYFQQQLHTQQLVGPQVVPLLKQQLLSQLPVPIDNGLQSSSWPSVPEYLSSTIQNEKNREQSWQIHSLPTIQNFVPITIDCNRNEVERQDQVELCSETEARRPRRRLTIKQSRDIISRREGGEPASYQTIAKIIGCSKSTVWRHKQKHLRHDAERRLVVKEYRARAQGPVCDQDRQRVPRISSCVLSSRPRLIFIFELSPEKHRYGPMEMESYQTFNPQPPQSPPYGYPAQPFGVNSDPSMYGHIPPSNPAQHQTGTFSSSFQAGGSPPLPPPPSGPPNATFPPQTSPNYNSNQSFTWDTLILPGNQPSPLFTRLLNGIFNHFISTAPAHPIGFDPIKFAAAFTALKYSDNNNQVRSLFIFATENHFPSPEKFVYDVLPMFYRAFEISYTICNGLPVLMREGFHVLLLRDTLGEPEVTWKRLNAFLAAHGNQVLDPLTGAPFPTTEIPRSALPAVADQGTWERVKTGNVDFNRELSGYLSEMMRMGRWKHDVTMASMSDGVWISYPSTSNWGQFWA